MADEMENPTLRVLQEIRGDIGALGQRLDRMDDRLDRLETEMKDVKKAVVGLSYAGAKIMAELKDHEDRITVLETR